ncbi:MAG: PmoA family protein [Planctomycetes bacterium]|nr:PmoA family protein [Planctomycetota bacterium]
MKTNLILFLVGWCLLAGAAWLQAAEPRDVTIQVGKDHVDFLVGKELVTRYHTGPDLAKPYAWPVYGPHQVPLTRAWPMEKALPGGSTDHVHQKSLWFGHGDIIPEGVPLKQKSKGVEGVDYWAEAPGHGREVCTEVGKPHEDRNHGWITTHNDWLTAEGTKILDETRTLHLYDFGATRLLVFDIDLRADVPVTFGDTKEGTMGVRVNDLIAEAHGRGKIENAEGKVGEKACWGRPSAWCDYSGPIEGRVEGIAILDDPSNPPACWHSRAYGLMAANPFGRAKSGFPAMKGKTDLIHLARGEHLKFRYGVLLHPGDAKEGKVGHYYQEFVALGKHHADRKNGE